jgi:hypothetical protein
MAAWHARRGHLAFRAVKIDQADMIGPTRGAKGVFERTVNSHVFGGKSRPGFALQFRDVDGATGRALGAFDMARHISTIEVYASQCDEFSHQSRADEYKSDRDCRK